MRKLLYLLINCILIVTVVAIPYPSYAATQTLTRTGGDGTTISAVDVGEGVYSAGGLLMWEFSAYTGGATISSVQFVVTGFNNCFYNGTMSSYCRIGGVLYTGTSTTTRFAGVSLAKIWNTNPATGLAWTAADISSADFGCYGSGIHNGEGLVIAFSDTSVIVTYILATPSITTNDADEPTYSGGSYNATVNADITSDGGATVDLEGFVWGTTSNSTNPLNIPPPATYTTNNTMAGSGVGAFEYNIGGLTKGTTYYYRAYAHNSQGWVYGDEKSFTALNDPSITTSAVSQITSSTARLNSLVSSDGGQECGVRFLRGTATGVYTSNTTLVSGYETGELPYADISGLAVATTYYVRAEITNDVSTQLGAEITFTTDSGVSAPTNLKSIPSATSVSLTWTKGTGSNKTLILLKKGSYPTSKTDGTQAYFDTKSSTVKTGLTSGTTYYVMAWGETSGLYSTANTTTMFTTVAGSSTDTTVAEIDTPPSNDLWFQSPDYTNMQYMPFYEIVNFMLDSFEIPKSTGWYMLALLISVTIGIVFYSSLGNHNLFLSIMAVGAVIIGMSVLKLVPLWNIVPFAIIAVVGIFVGERR